MINNDTFESIRAQNDNKLIVVGYSPTGNGHAARTLSIVTQALNDGHIKAGDVVLLHVPNIHEALPKFNPGAAVVDDAARKLTAAGIKVILAVADKAVIGYLDEQGASDNPRILSKFAEYPYRQPFHTHILDCGQLWTGEVSTKDLVYCGNDNSQGGETNLEREEREALPVSKYTISAKNLFNSLGEIIGDVALKEKVYVISDMDPYLQKAASTAGVPDKRRLDQQNHAILIQDAKKLAEIARSNAEIPASTLQGAQDMQAGDKAILAKVLDGSGSKVSHIGLGDQNTLQEKANTAIQLLETEDTKITAQTTRNDVKRRVIDYLDKNAEKIKLDEPYTAGKGGVMWHHDLEKENVQGIVYIYVHGASMPKVGEYIRQQIKINPEYRNKVFLFCGPGAMKKDANGHVGNALVLAYLAEADGVTNAGAGTTGEFVYLHRYAEDQSALALFPQINQHEQEANADYIQELYGRKSVDRHEEIPHAEGYVEVGSLRGNDFTPTLDSIVRHTQPAEDSRTMAAFFENVLTLDNNVITYPKQASDLLFADKVASSKNQRLLDELQQAEMAMRQDPTLKANRRYLKFVISILNELEQHIEHEIENANADVLVDGKIVDANPSSEALTTPFSAKFKQNSPEIQVSSASDVVEFLENDKLGANLIGGEVNPVDEVNIKQNLTSYATVCGFFKQVKAKNFTNDEAAKEIENIKSEIGKSIKVGF